MPERLNMIRIRFDGPPFPECGRFVEVEAASGESLIRGEWEQDTDSEDWFLWLDDPHALRARIAELEAELLDTVGERDRLEERVSACAYEMGCEAEWSNNHDHGECILSFAENYNIQAIEHARRIAELEAEVERRNAAPALIRRARLVDEMHRALVHMHNIESYDRAFVEPLLRKVEELDR